jgi:hypothetical protein
MGDEWRSYKEETKDGYGRRTYSLSTSPFASSLGSGPPLMRRPEERKHESALSSSSSATAANTSQLKLSLPSSIRLCIIWHDAEVTQMITVPTTMRVASLATMAARMIHGDTHHVQLMMERTHALLHDDASLHHYNMVHGERILCRYKPVSSLPTATAATPVPRSVSPPIGAPPNYDSGMDDDHDPPLMPSIAPAPSMSLLTSLSAPPSSSTMKQLYAPLPSHASGPAMPMLHSLKLVRA